MARGNGSSDINYVERCEAEAAAVEKRERYTRPVTLTPMEEWDRAVAERMDRDRCPRDAAVDRLLATSAGSSLWNRACMWDAAQPKVVTENGREVRSGNWQGSALATLRRIPRRP